MPNLPTLPNATVPAEGERPAPEWYTEPAKRVGAYIGVVVVVLTGLLAVVAAATSVLPADAQAEVAIATGIVGSVVVALTRVQAVLTRDRVWSPASIESTFGDPEYGGGNVAYPALPPVDASGAVSAQDVPDA